MDYAQRSGIMSSEAFQKFLFVTLFVLQPLSLLTILLLPLSASISFSFPSHHPLFLILTLSLNVCNPVIPSTGPGHTSLPWEIVRY